MARNDPQLWPQLVRLLSIQNARLTHLQIKDSSVGQVDLGIIMKMGRQITGLSLINCHFDVLPAKTINAFMRSPLSLGKLEIISSTNVSQSWLDMLLSTQNYLGNFHISLLSGPTGSLNSLRCLQLEYLSIENRGSFFPDLAHILEIIRSNSKTLIGLCLRCVMPRDKVRFLQFWSDLEALHLPCLQYLDLYSTHYDPLIDLKKISMMAPNLIALDIGGLAPNACQDDSVVPLLRFGFGPWLKNGPWEDISLDERLERIVLTHQGLNTLWLDPVHQRFNVS